MTLKNMTLKLYLSKYVSHNSKTWPSKFKIQKHDLQKHDPQSVSLKVLLYLSKILKVCP